MVPDEEKMNGKLERRMKKAQATKETASERFWKAWDLSSTERQRVFLTGVKALEGHVDSSTRHLPPPVRRQEYRRLMKIYLQKEIEGQSKRMGGRA